MKYYPAYLNLKNRDAVVVGGGKVAERKVRSLIKAGSSIKIVSPTLTAYLKTLEKRGKVVHIRRNYRKGDLKSAFIVVAATSSVAVNKKVAGDAEHLVNVVDPPDAGNFIVPSYINRGPMTIAISTEGASPAVSRSIRIEIERHYGREFAQYLRFVEKIRKKAGALVADRTAREKFLKSLADDRIFQRIRENGFESVSREIEISLRRLT